MSNNIDRAQRLKSAKSDATQEIEAYKLQKDQELKDFEAKVSGLLVFVRLFFVLWVDE